MNPNYLNFMFICSLLTENNGLVFNNQLIKCRCIECAVFGEEPGRNPVSNMRIKIETVCSNSLMNLLMKTQTKPLFFRNGFRSALSWRKLSCAPGCLSHSPFQLNSRLLFRSLKGSSACCNQLNLITLTICCTTTFIDFNLLVFCHLLLTKKWFRHGDN